jgi:uncharacterized membrane protein (GlpM family)
VQYLIKTVLSAIIIVLVSEFSKRSGFLGGLIASLPTVSLLAIIWLYIETRNVEKVISLSMGIFWMVIPSLSLFLVLPYLLKKQVPFYGALTLSCVLTGMVYYGATFVYEKLGIKL